MNSVDVRRFSFCLLCICFLATATSSLQAQQPEEKKPSALSEEEEGPLMFRFEPDFLTSVEVRREEIKRTRAIIDTLNISDRKRKRLLKELYKNGVSERLSREGLVETKFEDPEDNEN